MADVRSIASEVPSGAQTLNARSLRSLLTEHAEVVLRSLGSTPVLGPAIEDARPVDTRHFVRTMAPYLRMN
ncbi:MAG TPA: hypothetical protein VNI57_13945 [Candidatus Saccharimonadales bacterium]|nr:hypothetical protein [Candidatus Saccharimonadales bacterium]